MRRERVRSRREVIPVGAIWRLAHTNPTGNVEDDLKSQKGGSNRRYVKPDAG